MKLQSLNVIGFYYDRYLEISFTGFFAMVSVLCFLLLLSKTLRKGPIEIPKKEFDDFDYDVLQPQGMHVNVRKVKRSTKIVLYVLSGILIYTPLDELLKLNFQRFFYSSSWQWMF